MSTEKNNSFFFDVQQQVAQIHKHTYSSVEDINTSVMVHVKLRHKLSRAIILYMCVSLTPSPPTTHTHTPLEKSAVCGVWRWSRLVYWPFRPQKAFFIKKINI